MKLHLEKEYEAFIAIQAFLYLNTYLISSETRAQSNV